MFTQEFLTFLLFPLAFYVAFLWKQECEKEQEKIERRRLFVFDFTKDSK